MSDAARMFGQAYLPFFSATKAKFSLNALFPRPKTAHFLIFPVLSLGERRRKLIVFQGCICSIFICFQVDRGPKFCIQLSLKVSHDGFDVHTLCFKGLDVLLHLALGLFQFLLQVTSQGFNELD